MLHVFLKSLAIALARTEKSLVFIAIQAIPLVISAGLLTTDFKSSRVQRDSLRTSVQPNALGILDGIVGAQTISIIISTHIPIPRVLVRGGIEVHKYKIFRQNSLQAE